MNQIIRLTGRQGDRASDGRPMLRLAVVIPVLDDWRSFSALVGHVVRQVGPDVEWLEIVAVDDGSTERFDPTTIALFDDTHVDAIRIVHLALNLGHQRAIAVGLVILAPRKDLDHVIVMDSDGEDRPEDIPVLLEASRLSPDHVILAHRAKRLRRARIARLAKRTGAFLALTPAGGLLADNVAAKVSELEAYG